MPPSSGTLRVKKMSGLFSDPNSATPLEIPRCSSGSSKVAPAPALVCPSPASKVVPVHALSPAEPASTRDRVPLPRKRGRRMFDTGRNLDMRFLFPDFGFAMTFAAKAKGWAVWVWGWTLMACITGTFACLETTNPLLLGACALSFACLISIEAYETWGLPGMALAVCAFTGMGVGMTVFTKQIGMMEVWAKSYMQADVRIGLKDLEQQQRKLDKEAADAGLHMKEEEMVCVLAIEMGASHYRLESTLLPEFIGSSAA